MSGFDNTVPVNEVGFNEVNARFGMEYANNPNLFKMCEYIEGQFEVYSKDFQEKVNYTAVVAGSPVNRQRPQIRRIQLTPEARAARLFSDIFTKATLKENEIANFIKLILEALMRDQNQLVFDAVEAAITSGELPTGVELGSEVAPVTLNVDTILEVGSIFAAEGAPNNAVVVVNSSQLKVLMQDERFVSFFFNDRKPLPSGILMQTPAVGTQLYVVPEYPSQSQFVDNGILPTFDQGTPGTRCFAMTGDAFLCGCNITPYIKTWYDDDSLSWIVDGVHQSGVELQRPNGLIPIFAANS